MLCNINPLTVASYESLLTQPRGEGPLFLNLMLTRNHIHEHDRKWVIVNCRNSANKEIIHSKNRQTINRKVNTYNRQRILAGASPTCVLLVHGYSYHWWVMLCVCSMTRSGARSAIVSLLSTPPTHSNSMSSTTTASPSKSPIGRIVMLRVVQGVRMGIVMVRVVMRSARTGSLERVGGLWRAVELEGEWSVIWFREQWRATIERLLGYGSVGMVSQEGFVVGRAQAAATAACRGQAVVMRYWHRSMGVGTRHIHLTIATPTSRQTGRHVTVRLEQWHCYGAVWDGGMVVVGTVCQWVRGKVGISRNHLNRLLRLGWQVGGCHGNRLHRHVDGVELGRDHGCWCALRDVPMLHLGQGLWMGRRGDWSRAFPAEERVLQSLQRPNSRVGVIIQHAKNQIPELAVVRRQMTGLPFSQTRRTARVHTQNVIDRFAPWSTIVVLQQRTK